VVLLEGIRKTSWNKHHEKVCGEGRLHTLSSADKRRTTPRIEDNNGVLIDVEVLGGNLYSYYYDSETDEVFEPLTSATFKIHA